jgi:inner membrane protein
MTHPVVPIALSVFLPQDVASPSLLTAAAVCSVIPDLDVISFEFGIEYDHMLGHRGFTHSIFFAVALAAVVTVLFFRAHPGNYLVIFFFLFLSTLSHPILDAFTNGGFGVGFLAPFKTNRYFFPYRPIEVAPIDVGAFFSHRGFKVMISELKWVWLPSGLVFLVGQFFKRL